MATLVTGGTGFVGSNIVKALAERGHEVVSFDIVAPNALVEKYLKPWAEQVTFLQGDMLIEADLEPLAAHGVSKIVHAGVFTGVLPEVEAARSRSIVDINVMATTNLLELASRLSVERFLYVSSGSVYGEGHDPDGTLHEDSPLQPRSLYAVTKYTSELLTRRYGELHGFQTVSVRLGGPYGPMERVTGHRANQSLMKDWTGRLVRDEPIEVSDRTLRRSYTYVPDIAAGICAVLDAPSLSHDVLQQLLDSEQQPGGDDRNTPRYPSRAAGRRFPFQRRAGKRLQAGRNQIASRPGLRREIRPCVGPAGLYRLATCREFHRLRSSSRMSHPFRRMRTPTRRG